MWLITWRNNGNIFSYLFKNHEKATTFMENLNKSFKKEGNPIKIEPIAFEDGASDDIS